MTTMRKILYLAGLAVFVLVAAVFAYGNRGTVTLDLGFTRIDDVSMAGPPRRVRREL